MTDDVLPPTHDCRCLPLTETFHRGIKGREVPRCELHGTIGTAGKQGDTEAEALALNSEALERKLGDSLGAALNKPPFLNL